MSEVFENIQRVQKAIQNTDSIMEGVTVLATTLRVPGAMKSPEVVALAALMGGNLDDTIDKSDRGKAIELVEKHGDQRIRQLADKDHYDKYVKSWRSLIEAINESDLDSNNKQRMVKNSVTFFRNIKAVEMWTLAKGEKWNLEEALDYRKAVCLMWAEYFASMSPDSKLELKVFNSSDPNEILNEGKQVLAEDKAVADLYHGAVIYQFVADWTGRRYNLEHKIPGLGSLGSEEIKADAAWKIIEEQIKIARDKGVIGVFESVLFRRIFPMVRNVANARLRMMGR